MKIAFPTDEHFPYQDEDARSVALQIVRDFAPDIRITGSDGLDFYNLSLFNKNPERVKVNLQDEIDAWQSGQREWHSAAPEARPFYIVGNLEDRLRRYLWMHHELHGLEALKLPKLLDLASLDIDWEWSKDENANRELDLGKLVIKHGKYVRKFAAYSAKAELEAEFHATNLIHGHTHRGGTYYITTRHGLVQAIEGFCLCRLDPEYVQHPNWQQGIVLAEVSEELVSIESIPFQAIAEKKRAIWRGKEYRSE